MEFRPVIKLSLSPSDKYIEFLGWMGIAALWAIFFFLFDKSRDVIIPVVTTLLFVTLTILSRNPQSLNYPVKITPQNAAYQYYNAAKALRFYKKIIVGIGIIIFLGIKGIYNEKNNVIFSLGFILIILLLMLVPLVIFIRNSFRYK